MDKRSASKRIIVDVLARSEFDDSDLTSDLTASDWEGELDDDVQDEQIRGVDGVFQKPKENCIVNPDCLQSIFDDIVVCKECNSSLQIVEKTGSKQGLGAKWKFRCTKENCISHQYQKFLPTSPKSGKINTPNRASVL